MAKTSLTIPNVSATVAVQSNKVYPPQVGRGFYFLRSDAADKRYLFVLSCHGYSYPSLVFFRTNMSIRDIICNPCRCEYKDGNPEKSPLAGYFYNLNSHTRHRSRIYRCWFYAVVGCAAIVLV
jgi:hypothetical protein